MNIIQKILERQKSIHQDDLDNTIIPTHEPEVLFVGCIDARLDVIHDLGVMRGQALIMRNIAALIAGVNDEGKARATESATIEFAVKAKKVRHIIVMGHTHCGGIEGCLHGADLPEVMRYLEPIFPARDRVKQQGGDLDAQARTMEEEAVRLSLKNLITYPYVAEAVNANKIMLHGWVIDIVTKRLKVLNIDNGEFEYLV